LSRRFKGVVLCMPIDDVRALKGSRVRAPDRLSTSPATLRHGMIGSTMREGY
jgi:hypothetical protein